MACGSYHKLSIEGRTPGEVNSRCTAELDVGTQFALAQSDT